MSGRLKKRGLPKQHKCPNCSKSFVNEKAYRRHLLSHLQYHPHECDVCLECFSLKKLLQAHKETHTRSKSYVCSECPKTFPHVSVLNRHRLSHWEKPPFPCPICGEKFRTIPSRSRHVKNHIVSCALCQLDFQDFSQLINHIASVHQSKPMQEGKDDTPSYIIPIEPSKVAELEGNSSLNSSHWKGKSGDFTCFVCEQSFLTEQSMTTHLKAHRLYMCSHCPQFFDEASILRDHEFTHTGKHPFKCDTCLVIFRSEKLLTQHQKKCKLGTLPGQTPHELHAIMDAINNAVNISSDVKANVESAITTFLSENNESFQSGTTQSLLKQIDPHTVASVLPENTSVLQNRQVLQKALVLLGSELDHSNTPKIDFSKLFHCHWAIRFLEGIKPGSYPLRMDVFRKVHHINSSLIEQMGKLVSEAAITKEDFIFLNCIQKKFSTVLHSHFDTLGDTLS